LTCAADGPNRCPDPIDDRSQIRTSHPKTHRTQQPTTPSIGRRHHRRTLADIDRNDNRGRRGWRNMHRHNNTSGACRASPRIAVAVNADSMATWFTGVFGALDDVLFDIRIEDRDHSARLLREGVVMGAVTRERAPVPGCRVHPLGVMRYVPVASPSYVERYLPFGFTAHAVVGAPSLAWNRDDALQDMLVRMLFRRDIARRVHFVPTAEGFGGAVKGGSYGVCIPKQLTAPSVRGGSFVRIADVHLDVPLYWQCWKLDTPMVKKITDAVSLAAADLPPCQSLGHPAAIITVSD
jgi:LysR family transcriptional regulator (chromosome initiation inhibitor)